VVENSDLELIDFRIGSATRPSTTPSSTTCSARASARGRSTAAQRSGDPFVDFKYKNLPVRRGARPAVGWRTGDAVPPPVRRRCGEALVDTRGWALLGSRQVNGRADRDRIEVGKYEGKFSKLTMASKTATSS